MPDDVDHLNYNYWTSLTRIGCSGKIKNCFPHTKRYLKGEEIPYFDDSLFWSSFDRTESGACVALQSAPFNKDSNFNANGALLAPVFSSCNALNYFACEGEGLKSKYVDETKLKVK